MTLIPRLLFAGALLVAPLTSHADLIEQFVAAPRDCTPCVWFQAGTAGASIGHSGVLNLGSMPFGPNLYGGWLTFTPQGTFVSYLGGGATHEVLSPLGDPLADVRGAAKLGEAYGVIVDTGSGSIVGVTLYAGALVWTRTSTYLVLVGGIPTAYEFTLGGAPIGNVRGAARLAANVIDTDPSIGVAATLFSGALVYTPTRTVLLTTFGLGIGASEVLFGGAALADVRGVTAMGGDANPLGLDAGAFLWTPSRTLMLLTAGGVSVSEILDAGGASLARTWGITRQSPLYAGGGLFRGVATVINDEKEHLVFVSGGVTVSEVLRPSGGSLTSGVHVPARAPLLHQASNLSMTAAYHLRPDLPAGTAAVQGTVLGSEQ
jgi:hypothetical protein